MKPNVSAPVRHEYTNHFTGKKEVFHSCSKCMSVMVEMKCIHCSKRQKTQEEVNAMSEQMDAIVKEYNELTGKSVRRFASLAIGQKRLEEARYKRDNPTAPAPVKAKVKPIKANIAGHVKMSDSVRKSWDNPAIAKRRATRHMALVEGYEEPWTSVREAFVDLKLPLGRHIPFRNNLKKKLKGTFEHDGKQYHFTLKPRVKEVTTK